MLIFAWPNRDASVTKSIPDIAALVAHVWRRSYRRMGAVLLSLTALSCALFTLGMGRAASDSQGKRYRTFKPRHSAREKSARRRCETQKPPGRCGLPLRNLETAFHQIDVLRPDGADLLRTDPVSSMRVATSNRIGVAFDRYFCCSVT